MTVTLWLGWLVAETGIALATGAFSLARQNVAVEARTQWRLLLVMGLLCSLAFQLIFATPAFHLDPPWDDHTFGSWRIMHWYYMAKLLGWFVLVWLLMGRLVDRISDITLDRSGPVATHLCWTVGCSLLLTRSALAWLVQSLR